MKKIFDILTTSTLLILLFIIKRPEEIYVKYSKVYWLITESHQNIWLGICIVIALKFVVDICAIDSSNKSNN